ncbi:MAG TPA: class II aldolase/adducin family protein [Deltaproteobacteria bacterium]|nr:class II aldolase/adducin family protein [Deltaproteobacteria bacterium]
MLRQINKYLGKLTAHGLISNPGDAQFYGLDDEIYSNRDRIPEVVRALFDDLNINSLLIARPEPLRWAIIGELIRKRPETISPSDSESLTFIHDIPVIRSFDAREIAGALSRRKGCIVEGLGIVTAGSVALEQAFIVFSSICFATFVKYFADMLSALSGAEGSPEPSPEEIAACRGYLSRIAMNPMTPPLPGSLPTGETEIVSAMDAAGKTVVAAGLVDSFFGNISAREGDHIYISQTGSSLDELEGHIDRTAMDGSSTCEITSSSELCAHVRIYELTGNRIIIHGHPRFSVIMSMAGGRLAFGDTRHIGGVPVVAGEVGAGARGLVHTLPEAIKEHQAAIVSGHGTFVASDTSFHDAFVRLASIEEMCFHLCIKAVNP